MTTKMIQAECNDCGGTGVYCGFMEPRGTGVVCLGCNGSGAKVIQYAPYAGRKEKRGIETVMMRATRGIFETDNPKTSMTYREFQARVPAGKVQ